MTRTARLIELLGLSDAELCEVLDVDALTVVSGQAEDSPQLAILVDLVGEAADAVGATALRGWVRRGDAGARPIDALLAHDFGAFESALGDLVKRGVVLRGGG
jgi:hypothetical protein